MLLPLREGLLRAVTKHGGVKTPEYSSWRAMRERCRNSRTVGFANYGGRGITVCARWGDFANFLADMGPKPTPKHSIDRINNDGNYEPGNCRWSTRVEQVRNQRPKRSPVARSMRFICLHGHALTTANTYHKANGNRACRMCRKRTSQEAYRRKRVPGMQRQAGERLAGLLASAEAAV